MTWLMIRPVAPEDGELADVKLPEPLRFKVRDLTVAEHREYSEEAQSLLQEVMDFESLGDAPAEDADDYVKAQYTIELSRITAKSSQATYDASQLMVRTFVTDFDGYDSLDDLPEFYLGAIAEKIRDFMQARSTLSWTLDVGTAQAKPSKGRK